MIADVVTVVLLALALLVCLFSVVGFMLGTSVLVRLHFVTPPSVVAPVLIAGAVISKEALSVRGLSAALVAVLFVVLQPLITHATAHAATTEPSGDPRGR